MTLEQFLQYIVTPAGLGVIVTVVTHVLQRMFPKLKGDWAFFVSVVVAVVVALTGHFFLPVMAALDPEVVRVVFPVLVWAANYFWHRFSP